MLCLCSKYIRLGSKYLLYSNVSLLYVLTVFKCVPALSIILFKFVTALVYYLYSHVSLLYVLSVCVSALCTVEDKIKCWFINVELPYYGPAVAVTSNGSAVFKRSSRL